MTPKIFNSKIELIAEVPVIQAKSRPINLKKMLAGVGIPLEEIVEKKAPLPKAKTNAVGKFMPQNHLPAAPERLYFRTGVMDSEMNPWDVAHQAAGAFSTKLSFVEPDLLKEFMIDTNVAAHYKKSKNNITSKKKDDGGFDPDWPPQQDIIWHLDNEFSQLKAARDSVMDLPDIIRIGHLDTGYDKTHTIIPDTLRQNKLQRNFVDGEDAMDAHDRKINGTLRMPLHGTGTGGILCGNKIKLQTAAGIFHDYLGAAPFAEVIPCRLANSVVLFKTSAFAEAIEYLTNLTYAGTTVHVVSMSMGGAPSKAWADAVNRAYDAGIVLVTATGNNFNGLPTSHVVYPARFGRVIGACGVTHALRPYHTSKIGEMQGCFGPERHMDKVLAAFTPNTPWASGSASKITFSGAGTSSATPQIAAAAAIYYRKHYTKLMRLQPWQRVEAIRYALFSSASKKAQPIGSFKKSFGNGILKAMDALNVPVNDALARTPEDRVPWFPILNTIFKTVPGRQPANRAMMFNTELAQLAYNYPELRKIISDEEKSFDKVSKTQWNEFRDAVIEHPATSRILQKQLIYGDGKPKLKSYKK